MSTSYQLAVCKEELQETTKLHGTYRIAYLFIIDETVFCCYLSVLSIALKLCSTCLNHHHVCHPVTSHRSQYVGCS